MASIAIDKTWLIRATFPRFPQDTSKSTAKLYREGIPSTKITIRLTTCTQHTKKQNTEPQRLKLMPLKLYLSLVGSRSYDARTASGSEMRVHAHPIPSNQKPNSSWPIAAPTLRPAAFWNSYLPVANASKSSAKVDRRAWDLISRLPKIFHSGNITKRSCIQN